MTGQPWPSAVRGRLLQWQHWLDDPVQRVCTYVGKGKGKPLVLLLFGVGAPGVDISEHILLLAHVFVKRSVDGALSPCLPGLARCPAEHPTACRSDLPPVPRGDSILFLLFHSFVPELNRSSLAQISKHDTCHKDACAN